MTELRQRMLEERVISARQFCESATIQMERFATADLQLIPDFTLVVLSKNGKTNRRPHDLVNVPEEPAAML